MVRFLNHGASIFVRGGHLFPTFYYRYKTYPFSQIFYTTDLFLPQ